MSKSASIHSVAIGDRQIRSHQSRVLWSHPLGLSGSSGTGSCRPSAGVVGLGKMEMRWIESGEIAHEGESAGAYWFRDGKIIR